MTYTFSPIIASSQCCAWQLKTIEQLKRSCGAGSLEETSIKMTENQDLVDFDSLCGVPSEDLFEKLLSDATFVDFFNTFLALPVFGKRLTYNRADDNFRIDPPPARTCHHLPCYRVKKWAREERIKFFWKTDLFLEYLLCISLHEAAESSRTSIDLEQARCYLGTTENMRNFHRFLRGTTGQNILFFWIDAERFRRVTKREHRRFAFRDIQAKYLRSGSPRELPEIMKWASICGGVSDLERKSSFKFPKSVINRMYLSDASIFSENVFIPGQKMALERLISYWVPKFIEHKKNIRRLIEEKRRHQSELQLSPRCFSPIQEEVDEEVPVSQTKSEEEMNDFMEAQCVSSTESVVETEEEIRARKLEEWKRWFWNGIDENETGNEDKVEPPKDMPMELLRLGGIRNVSPSSPVPPEPQDTSVIPEEEDEAISSSHSSDGGSQSIAANSQSFSYPRCLVISPKERSLSEPAFTSADLMRWHKILKEGTENERDNLEETRVNLLRLQQPYALLPTSAPRKLKTQYEALASEQSIIAQGQEAELCESSTGSNSPSKSLAASPPQTALLALRRASAARVIPFEDIGQEIAAMVSVPRTAYPRATPQSDQLIPCDQDNSTVLSKPNKLSTQALVALTADKLAGGPLREYLEKTQENTALRSLQFWDDAQRYLSPLKDFGSYSKFHSAKTLIATYIAPDSPRQMAMSPRVRDDLMRLLPGEKGDHLLATVVKNSLQAVTLPWYKYIRSDEDHFISSAGIPRKSADKRTDNKSKTTTSEETNVAWNALQLAVGFGVSDLYLGQDDDDNEELELLHFDMKIPSLKDYERQMEMLNIRNRRSSHFYGHFTRQDEESSEGKKTVTLHKLRPPKPRCFNDILRDTLQLVWFKRFLSEKQCEAPLLFWQAVENMKTNCKDGKARQAKASIIVRKYFTNISMPAVEYLHCTAEIIRDIPCLDKTTPPMLVSAQTCVARSMEENWYNDYLATFPEDETEGENFGRYTMRNTLAGVYKMAAHGKTRGLWAMFAHNVMLFQRGIHNPDSLAEFKMFLKKEAKSIVEQNLRRHSLHPTRRMVNSKVVNADRLISDLEFWMEVERFKIQADNAAECARSGNYTLEDENLLLDKAKTIVKCYIDSEVPPRVQINVPVDMAENIEGLVQTGIVERGLFHDAAFSVFTSLIYFWKKFSAERFAKPVEQSKPPSTYKRASSKKRTTSVIAGMPYKKVYTATDDEVHWSYSLNHGLRLVVPIKFVIARRVATQLGHDSEGMSESASLPTGAPTP